MPSSASSGKRSQSRFGSRERLVTAAIALILAIVILVLGGSDKWLTAEFATLVPFLAIVSYFRARWRHPQFWAILGVLLVAHLALIWLIFAIVLRRRDDVNMWICVPFMLAESSALYY